jgi:hypothetical protein
VEARALPHGTTRSGRWLREWRFRLALWIAVVEGLLIVFDVVSGWVALLVGAVLVIFYFSVGRGVRWDALRQVSWVAALSQALVAFVPVLAFVVGVLAILAVAVLALVALAALLADRR